MKKIVLLASFVLVFAVMAMAATVPAGKEIINLKTAWAVKGSQKAVMFNHAVHTKVQTCADCHSSPAGGTKIVMKGKISGAGPNNPAHKFCFTACHAKLTPDPVKRTCTKCHTGPK